ncbi:MAG: transcriptional regulator, partial [Candidatus Helarchaeota archaeon]
YMLFPCEFVVKKILPAIRAAIVKELYETYHLKQQEIAKKLGITQPSVSLYLSGDRGGFNEVFEKIDKKVIKSLVDELMKEESAETHVMREICSQCMQLRKEGQLIELLCKVNPSLENSICELCWKAE